MALTRWGKKREVLKRAEELLCECCEHLGLGHKAFSKTAKRWILTRRWHGDDRALRRAIYSAAISASDDEITAGHFTPCVRRDRHEYMHVQAHEMALDELMREKITQFYTRLGRYEVEGVYKAVMDQVEKPLMEETLSYVRGNKLKAARILGINRNTLSRKIRSLNIMNRSVS